MSNNLQLSDSDKLKHLYTSALFGGTSLAAAAMLVDMLRSHKRKTEAEAGKEPDTITLYMPPPKDVNKAASDDSPAAGLHDIVGATLLAGGSFYAWNTLLKKWRKEQLKREIEDSAKNYMAEVSNQKMAWELPRPASAGSILRNSLDSLLILSALVGGAGTYGILSNTFPKVAPKNVPGKPKKIVVKGFGTVHVDDKPGGAFVQMDKERQRESVEEDRKPTVVLDAPTTYRLDEIDTRKAAAFTAMILCDRECESSPMGDVFGRIILDGGAEKIASVVREAGMDGTISACKGLHSVFRGNDAITKHAAIAAAFDNDMLRPSLGVLTIAELNEVHPGLAKMAKELSNHPTCGPVSLKLASCFYDIEAHNATTMEKSATAIAASPMAQEWVNNWGKDRQADSEEVQRMDDEPDQRPDEATDPIDDFMAGKK